MFKLLIDWYKRRFSDPNAVSFAFFILIIGICFYFFHQILWPILIALILAYILEWPVRKLTFLGLNRTLSSVIVTLFFVIFVLLILVILLPIFWQQMLIFLKQVPNFVDKIEQELLFLLERFFRVEKEEIRGFLNQKLRASLLNSSESILYLSLNSLLGFFTLLTYGFILPLMIFFMLKDKNTILRYIVQFLPKNQRLMRTIMNETHQQMGLYFRGVFIEMMILICVSYLVFFFFKLDYAFMLSILVGLSILIPYIGILITSFLVALLAFSQFGFEQEFFLLLLCYELIRLLDGNLLSPLLYSEIVNLHPLTTIISILIFGGIWGAIGVIFAVPLVLFIQIILKYWPNVEN